MKRFTVALVFLVGLAGWPLDSGTAGQPTPSPAPKTITGEVVRIADGDTITVLAGRRMVKVRLLGVDCPEKKQPYGQAAKQFTSDLAFGKRVSVAVDAKPDRYGRSLGTVTLPDGHVLNQELVRAGMAWWYQAFSKDATLAALEKEAKAAKRGLWQQEAPEAPWLYRQRVKKRSGGSSPVEVR